MRQQRRRLLQAVAAGGALPTATLAQAHSGAAASATPPSVPAPSTSSAGAATPAGSAPTPAPAPRAPLVARYRLAFADDFDDGDVSRINEDAVGRRGGPPAWRSRYRHPRQDIINDEKQIYVDPAYAGSGQRPLGIQPFSMRGGVLSISAARTDPQRHAPFLWGKRFSSGCITTEYTHWQTFGYFEMRARLPVGRGFWPAFWLLPKRDAWPPEIDVFEASGLRPDQVFCNVIDRQPKLRGADSGWVSLPPADAAGYRVFGMEWTAAEIAFFVDGRRIFAVRDHGIAEDMYLLANLALGSRDPGWIPDPDDTTPLPASFDIDYVRAWTRT